MQKQFFNTDHKSGNATVEYEKLQKEMENKKKARKAEKKW